MGQNSRTVALSNDYLAIIDRGDSRVVRIIDVASGKPLAHSITHTLEVLQIGVSQHGLAIDRKLYVLDRNHDLYIALINPPSAAAGGKGGRKGPAVPSMIKLASMVDCAIWHDTTDMLAAVCDSKVTVWCASCHRAYPTRAPLGTRGHWRRESLEPAQEGQQRASHHAPCTFQLFRYYNIINSTGSTLGSGSKKLCNSRAPLSVLVFKPWCVLVGQALLNALKF